MATKSKPSKVTLADHKRVVEKGLNIMKNFNDTIDGEHGSFAVVGDPNATKLKSFSFKVWCMLCGDLI